MKLTKTAALAAATLAAGVSLTACSIQPPARPAPSDIGGGGSSTSAPATATATPDREEPQMGTAVGFMVYAAITLTTVFQPATNSVQASQQGAASVSTVWNATHTEVTVSAL